MKSIVQEASTIAKAIEQGWKEAGQPQEFSIKILETPEHNFLGMTTRSAKVALFFNHTHQNHSKDEKRSQKKERTSRPKQNRPKHANQLVQAEPKQTPVEQKKQAKKPTPKRKNSTPQAPKVNIEVNKKEVTPERTEPKPTRKKAAGMWNDELVQSAQEWFEKTLKVMNKSDISFTIEPQNFYLRITLNQSLLKDEAKEKHLLASLSSLMLATVKKRFRKALRGHKIVLTHA